MTDELEQRLRAGAEHASRLAQAASLPEPPQIGSASRTRVFALVGVACVLAIVAGVLVVAHDDPTRTISPLAPPETSSPSPLPATSTIPTPASSVVVTNSSVPDATSSPISLDPTPASTLPVSNSDTPTTFAPEINPTEVTESSLDLQPGLAVTGPSISEGAARGLPLGLGNVPAGYRVANVTDNTGGSVSRSSSGDGWSATYLHEPLMDGQLVDYAQISIRPVTNGDPYNGFPGLADQSPEQIGPYDGRWYAGFGANYSTYVAPMTDGNVLLISGRADRDTIRAFITGLQPRTGQPGQADVTTVPDGYVKIDEGPDSGPVAETEHNLIYVKGQASRTAIDVRTFVHPSHAALLDALGPEPARFVDINGAQGVFAHGRLSVDFSPDYQVQITVGDPGWNFADVDQLADLARSLVAIDDNQLHQYWSDAIQGPLAPTDMDCAFYINLTNPRSTVASTGASPNGHPEYSTPATITVDIKTGQPLLNVTFSIQVGNDKIPIKTLPSLTDPTTIDLTWDGTANGALAPAGTYENLIVTADAANTADPDHCTSPTNNPGYLGGGPYFGAAFQVP